MPRKLEPTDSSKQGGQSPGALPHRTAGKGASLISDRSAAVCEGQRQPAKAAVARKRRRSATHAKRTGDAADVEHDALLVETALASKTIASTKPSPLSKATVTKQVKTKKLRQPPEKEILVEDVGDVEQVAADARPKKRARKTKEEKEATSAQMPLAPRTIGHKLAIGAHVSAAGGVHKSVDNSLHVGCNAFALFLKSQRKWENPALKPEHAEQFKTLCQDHSYNAKSYILPHGSYLVNLAQADHAKAEQAYNSFLDDLKRCETLGIQLYNFHPGNTNGAPRHEAIARIAANLNRAHKATSTVVTLLENMAAAGNTVGGCFEDLRDIIALVEDKSRVGVCLDTAHAFASGFELRDLAGFRNTMSLFDKIVGAKYLRAVHLNDSKAPYNSRRDLHQNIGLGFLGLRAFHNLVNEPRFEGLPLVLETPIDVKDSNGKSVEDKSIWAREIKLLESLVGMDPEADEFKQLEQELAERGATERQQHAEQQERKLKKQSTARTKANRKVRGGGGDKVNGAHSSTESV